MQKIINVSKAIDALMKLVEEKMHDRHIAFHKGKIRGNLKTWKYRHDISKKLLTANITLENRLDH